MLNEMTGEEIDLSVPSVSFPRREEAIEILTGELDRRVAIVTQTLTGALTGRAALLIVDDQSAALVKILIDPDLAMEDVTELEAEALCELGNVVLNSAMGLLADSLEAEIAIGLPEISRGTPEAIVNTLVDPVLPSIVVRISLTSVPTGIGGLLMFVLDEPSMKTLRAHVESLAAELA